MLSVFIFRAEGHRILFTSFIYQSISVTPRMMNLAVRGRFVEFDCHVDVSEDVCCREKNVEEQDSDDRAYHLYNSSPIVTLIEEISEVH